MQHLLKGLEHFVSPAKNTFDLGGLGEFDQIPVHSVNIGFYSILSFFKLFQIMILSFQVNTEAVITGCVALRQSSKPPVLHNFVLLEICNVQTDGSVCFP